MEREAPALPLHLPGVLPSLSPHRRGEPGQPVGILDHEPVVGRRVQHVILEAAGESRQLQPDLPHPLLPVRRQVRPVASEAEERLLHVPASHVPQTRRFRGVGVPAQQVPEVGAERKAAGERHVALQRFLVGFPERRSVGDVEQVLHRLHHAVHPGDRAGQRLEQRLVAVRRLRDQLLDAPLRGLHGGLHGGHDVLRPDLVERDRELPREERVGATIPHGSAPSVARRLAFERPPRAVRPGALRAGLGHPWRDARPPA